MSKNVPRFARAVGAAVTLALAASAGGAVAGAAGVADGDDTARAGRATTTTLARRKVTQPIVGEQDLLILPGLGRIRTECEPNTIAAWVTWLNDRPYPIDAWNDAFAEYWPGRVVASGARVAVASFGAHNHRQYGSTLHLGQGNNPGPRRMADVRIHAYRESVGAPCGFDVIATTWSSE